MSSFLFSFFLSFLPQFLVSSHPAFLSEPTDRGIPDEWRGRRGRSPRDDERDRKRKKKTEGEIIETATTEDVLGWGLGGISSTGTHFSSSFFS